MPRPGVTTTVLAALQAPLVQPAIFVQVQFLSATAYLWSGVGSITWNGQTWTGLGSLLSLAAAEDAATVEARGMTIVLSGLDASLLSSAMGDFGLGLQAIVYFGMYSGGSLIPTPITTWSGRTDQPTVDIGGDTATISIGCENRLLDMNVAVDRRLTSQDQQMTWPGDLGLQFVDGLQEMTLYWGQVANSTNNI